MEKLVPDGAGCCFVEVVSDDAGRGALRSPTPPRVTGCERVATLSRSPGVGVTRNLVSGDAGNVLLREFVSDDTGVGRSAPLHPLGDGVREGCDPLALSRGWGDAEFGFL